MPFSLWACEYSYNNPAIPMQYYLFTFLTIPLYIILTLPKLRRKCWDLFAFSHIVGNWIILGGLLWHANQMVYLLWPTMYFYVFDRVLRYVKSSQICELTSLKTLDA